MIYYLIAVGLCWLVFYSCYEILLARLTFFKVNRFYLLATLLLGLILPLTPAIDWLTSSDTIPMEEVILLKPVVITMQAAEQSIEEIVVTPIAEASRWNWEDGLLLIYFIGLLIAGLRFIMGIEKISRLRKNAQLEKRDGYVLVKTRQKHLPFSFFNYLFWSEKFMVEKSDEDRIIRHELAHIKGGHSVDVLILEVVKMFFWYIPFVYLYKKAITEVHEYLADAAVINTFQKKKQYGLLLLRQSQSGHQVALANHFIHSQLKKRLLMMTRNKTHFSAMWKYVLVIPFVGMLSYIFAMQQQPVQQALDKTIHVIGYGADGHIPDFNAQQIFESLQSDLADLKNDRSEKAQHNAYNVFSARYVKLMNDYPSHQQEITKLAYKAINEVNAPFVLQETKDYNFTMVIPNWVKEKSVVGLNKNIAVPKPAGEVFKVVEEMPLFKGCESEDDLEFRTKCSQKRMLEFVYKNIKYPALARKAGIQGTAIVGFVVTKEGTVAEPKLIREIGGGCGDEVLRIISQMPKWTPGKQGGKNVNVHYVLPVKYKLDGDKTEKIDKLRAGIFDKLEDGERPLIIIDEAEADYANLKSLSPDDIELVNVLKGEAAEKKYGKKAANGVIEVLTKKLASSASSDKVDNDELFQVVEEMPRFPGCEDETDPQVRKNCSMKRMMEFMYKNIRYPKAAGDNGTEGTVVVRFVVDKTGAIRDAELKRDIGDGCGDAAINVVEMMPDWIPGKQKGKEVNVVINLPVKFKLGTMKSEETEPSATDATKVFPNATLVLDNFSAFPNPAEDQINIRFQAEKAVTTVSIIDAAGKELFRDEQSQFSGQYDRQVSLKNMPRGAVYIHVKQGDAKYIEKIILQ